jgi:uncharacterized protein (TIGR03083 family)
MTALNMQPLEPCLTAALFRPLSEQLVTLLRGLAPADWERPTVSPQWRLRDVAAHLLDGQLRRISVQRDRHLTPPDGSIASERDLAAFINRLNAGGVDYSARLSTRLITDLLEVAAEWLAADIASLDPHGPAVFPVSWAGESTSENWMDIGREYTEHWHHQMQIRDAVAKPRLLEPKWMAPLLDLSVRALPHVYEGVAAPAGSVVTLEVSGETSGAWSIVRDTNRWQLRRGRPAQPDATVSVSADDAWRMFYNALSGDALAQRVKVEGKTDLAAPLLRARSVIV